MAFEHFIRSGQKVLRCGYTTGTCAALATQGAAALLLGGHAPETLALTTPKGLAVEVQPVYCRMADADTAVCAVQKDAGDDPDVTDGIVIEAYVQRTDAPGVAVCGGRGVGRVTRPGLDQPVGAAAINRVPRQQIERQARSACRVFDHAGGLKVTICVPGGEELARRTFNPRLGVEGGISILGTSGIVEPMSERALIDTIELQMRQTAADAKRLILTPGNYGTDFLQARGWDELGIPVVRCSNYIGEALDSAAGLPFEEVLLVGHIGKLVKLAGGVMNTHSRMADCRAELFCAHAACCGADTAVCRRLMQAATADACIEILDEAGLREPVLGSLLLAIEGHLTRRVAGAYRIGAVLFSNQFGLLAGTETAAQLLERFQI